MWVRSKSSPSGNVLTCSVNFLFTLSGNFRFICQNGGGFMWRTSKISVPKRNGRKNAFKNGAYFFERLTHSPIGLLPMVAGLCTTVWSGAALEMRFLGGNCNTLWCTITRAEDLHRQNADLQILQSFQWRNCISGLWLMDRLELALISAAVLAACCTGRGKRLRTLRPSIEKRDHFP